MNNIFDGMHPDYEKMKPFTLSFNFFITGLLNCLMRVERWRNCRPQNPELKIKKISIAAADGYRIPVYQMTPINAAATRPVVLYYHGGAFALTWASLHWKSCEKYALATGATVLLVDYRLGPRYVFPTPLDDCYAALAWVRSNAAAEGFDTSRIAAMGDSAGGYFAAAVAQQALDRGQPITAQALIYPALDSDCKTWSATEFREAPIWNSESNRRMWVMFLKNVSRNEAEPPYASPGHREDLSNLPPAYVETAEFDPLRDEGMAYADGLSAAGVEVVTNYTMGTVHGYEMSRNNPAVAASMEQRCEFLKRVLTA